MNNTTSALSTNTSSQDLQLLKSLSLSFILWIICGLTNVTASLLTLIIFIKFKPMNKETRILMLQISVNEFIGSILFTLSAMYHLVHILYDSPETNSPWICYLYCGYDIFIIQSLNLFSLILSLERFVLILFPNAFKDRCKRLIYYLCGAGWLGGLLYFAVSFVDISTEITVPICILRFSLGNTFFNVVNNYISLIHGTLTVIIYLLLMIILRCQAFHISNSGSNLAEIKERMNNTVTKSLMAIAIVHLLTFTFGAFGNSIVSPFILKGAIAGPYFACLFHVGGIVDFPIYYIFQKKFRFGCQSLVKDIFTQLHSNTVEPIHITGPFDR